MMNKSEIAIDRQCPEIRDFRKIIEDLHSDKPTYKTVDLGEDMIEATLKLNEAYGIRFLLDKRAETANVLSWQGCMRNVYGKDICWWSLPQRVDLYRSTYRFLTREYDGVFPVTVYEYHDGAAMVKWQVQSSDNDFPDNYYKGDIVLYGFIDRRGRVLVRFRTITDRRYLKRMERRAQGKARKKMEHPERYIWKETKRLRRLRELYEERLCDIRDAQGRYILGDYYEGWP